MSVSQLDSVQLWALAAAVGLTLSAWVLGRLHKAGPQQSARSQWLAWLESRSGRGLAVVFVACLAFSDDALVSQWRHPVPEILDEFSYLLQADTFAHGRMANPPPPLPQAFEAPYVLVRPTYQGRYPPGQALFLAFGQRLFARPLVGVWLSSAAFAAALCWMLQAWLPPVWALWGSLLAICQLACFGHWAQSYWGGMVAASGGALLFGALRRLIDSGRRRVLDATVLAVGLVVLANTRPYEGLLMAVPAVVALGVFLWRPRRHALRAAAGRTLTDTAAGDCSAAASGAKPLSKLPVVLPILIVLALAAGLMAYYNQRVTQNPWTLPYQAYERQYNPAPILFFQGVRSMPGALSPAMQSTAVDALEEMHWARERFLDFITSKLFFFWQFAFGAVLGLPLLLALLVEWRRWYGRILLLIAYAGVQLIALCRFLFWPTPSRWLVAALLIALLIQHGLLLRVFCSRWERLALLAIGLVLLATLSETARFRTHYVAPIVPLTIFLVTEAMRRLFADRQHMFRALPIAAVVPLLALATTAAASFATPTPVRVWAQKRAEIQAHLENQPGKQLVLVKYGESSDYYEEWVYNRGNLEHAKVVWARDLGTTSDNELIRYFRDRNVWWLDAATGDLQAHPPRDTSELPLLP